MLRQTNTVCAQPCILRCMLVGGAWFFKTSLASLDPCITAFKNMALAEISIAGVTDCKFYADVTEQNQTTNKTM